MWKIKDVTLCSTSLLLTCTAENHWVSNSLMPWSSIPNAQHNGDSLSGTFQVESSLWTIAVAKKALTNLGGSSIYRNRIHLRASVYSSKFYPTSKSSLNRNILPTIMGLCAHFSLNFLSHFASTNWGITSFSFFLSFFFFSCWCLLCLQNPRDYSLWSSTRGG